MENLEEINKNQKIFIKGFDKDLKCRGMQFKVGKEYKIKNKSKDLILCEDTVFHFCRTIQQVHNYYSCNPSENNRFCEIEVLGNMIEEENDKCGSNHIKIIREIKGEELKRLLGLDRNLGLFNSGCRNSGGLNSGDQNSGSLNSGDQNSGYQNSGYRNSGNLNSGNLNSGNQNSGDLNSGYRNSGVFCTKKQTDTVPFFNKESKMTWKDWYNHPAYKAALNLNITVWIDWDNMTDEERKNNPKSYVCGGYLKVYEYKEAWLNLWNNLNESEKESFKSLPNFNEYIFEEVTGIKFLP